MVLCTQGDGTNNNLVLIPSSQLRGDLPPALIDGHVHWLNLSTKSIEIRPLDQIWQESSEYWRIDCASGQYRVCRGNETLVDVRSPTWAMLSRCFEHLNVRSSDEYKDLIITTSPTHSVSVPRLYVTLPRYSLSFFVNDMEELESRDFEHMVYDEDQHVGALFGLNNMLVLRPTQTLVPRTLIPRRVLVPNGELIMHEDHQVQINTPNGHSDPPAPDGPLYHIYTVDTELGCLMGNGSLASTEFLARLYAMTSCHRPDPLTGKTGAQAALDLLQSAGCRSLMNLKAVPDRSGSWKQYPPISAAYKEIHSGYTGGRDVFRRREVCAEEGNAAQRAAYLFPLNAASPEDDARDHFTASIPSEPGLPTLSCMVSSLRCIFNGGPPTQITLDYLMFGRSAPSLPARIISPGLHNTRATSSDDVSALDQIFSQLRTDHPFQQQYLTQLDASAQHVRSEPRVTHRLDGENLVEVLKEHYMQCRDAYLDALEMLKKCLGPSTAPYEQAHIRFGQWPSITADTLLRYLASTSRIDIPSGWKKCLASLALLLSDLQRARRLLRFALDGLEEDLSKELENEGCDGWNPEDYPDWLLIQVGVFCQSSHLY